MTWTAIALIASGVFNLWLMRLVWRSAKTANMVAQLTLGMMDIASEAQGEPSSRGDWLKMLEGVRAAARTARGASLAAWGIIETAIKEKAAEAP